MRVMIAEDSVILRDGLAALLTRRGHEVVGAVGDATALVAAVTALAAGAGEAEGSEATEGTGPTEGTGLPDVAVVDVRMPPTFRDEGLRAALELRARFPELGVLLFSQYVETRFAAQLLAGGARGVGYLLKDRVADVGDFLAALERIADGQTVLDPEVVTQLLGASRSDGGLGRLSAREREVLELMAQGRSNGAIAEHLVLSYGAVEKHVTSIFTKLDLAPDAGDHRRVLAVLRYLQRDR